MIIGYHRDRETGRLWLLIGLERRNIDRLQQGETIRVNHSSHGHGCPEELDLLITFGESIAAIEADLNAQGILDRATQRHDYREKR